MSVLRRTNVEINILYNFPDARNCRSHSRLSPTRSRRLNVAVHQWEHRSRHGLEACVRSQRRIQGTGSAKAKVVVKSSWVVSPAKEFPALRQDKIDSASLEILIKRSTARYVFAVCCRTKPHFVAAASADADSTPPFRIQFDLLADVLTAGPTTFVRAHICALAPSSPRPPSDSLHQTLQQIKSQLPELVLSQRCALAASSAAANFSCRRRPSCPCASS